MCGTAPVASSDDALRGAEDVQAALWGTIPFSIHHNILNLYVTEPHAMPAT